MKHSYAQIPWLARTLHCCLKLGLASVALGGAGCSDAMTEPPFAHDPPPAYVPVAAYFAALNAHSFDNATEFASADWNSINPRGTWSRGREAAVAAMSKLEAGVLKDVTFSVKGASIVYASSDVALVTTTSLAAHTPPDEALERTTFVVVKERGRWQLFEDQVTTVSDDTVVRGQGSQYEGPVPSDVGGVLEAEDIRTEKAHASVDWFNALPVEHDFDRAADFTTLDLNLITPTGRWTQNRQATLSEVTTAFTTFLDGAIFAEDELVVHFPTDDVAVQIQARTTTHADEQTHEVATCVVVNHQNRWLLANNHVTRVP
jgi:ketosteroid isomerase-like protein